MPSARAPGCDPAADLYEACSRLAPLAGTLCSSSPGGALTLREWGRVKVLLVVIDAASPRVVCPAIHTGRLPNLQRIADAGRMHESSVTIFPSITPAATSSIITGAYPAGRDRGGFLVRRGHAASGVLRRRFWTITKEGYGPFLRDFLVT